MFKPDLSFTTEREREREMENRKLKIILWLAVTFIVVNSIVYFVTELNQQQRIKIALDSKIKQLKTHYDILINHQTKIADATFKSTIKIKKVQEILTKATKTKDKKILAKLRDDLQKTLSYKYELLKEEGVLQYHFVLPNNISFLRMHKPSKFGDDLSNIRLDMAKVNKEKKIVRGFHQGRTAHGFRNVYPLFNDKKVFLGSLEVSFSSDTFQNNLLDISKVHAHFLVNRTIFKSKAWERKDLIVKYVRSSEHDDYMFAIGGIHTKQRCVIRNKKKLAPLRDKINNGISLGKSFGVFTPWKDEIQTITFLPIKNSISNEVSAWLVSYEQSPFIQTTITNTNVIRAISFFGLLILLYFVYRVINQKDILSKEVEKQTKSLMDKNRELEQKDYELREINENLEQRIIIEVEKSKKQQKQILESAKMAQMGEMIGNIAHQWRQPLSVISTSVTGIIMQKEYGILTDESLIKSCNSINDTVQYLSKTIDDFRNYIKGERKLKNFDLKEVIDKFLNLIGPSIKNHNLEVILDLQEDIKLDGYPNELTQCFMNIFNNAKDILAEQDKDRKLLFITTTQRDDDKVIISFKDSGGGVPEDIIDKIFEPYFTTKHQSQGTGLGLHMIYEMIVSGMNGEIEVANENYNYEGKNYTGACFTIILPLINK